MRASGGPLCSPARACADRAPHRRCRPGSDHDEQECHQHQVGDHHRPSSELIESMISFPIPGQEKIVFVTTAKASVELSSSPNTVTSGSRSTAAHGGQDRPFDSPAARAKPDRVGQHHSRVPARAGRIISRLDADAIARMGSSGRTARDARVGASPSGADTRAIVRMRSVSRARDARGDADRHDPVRPRGGRIRMDDLGGHVLRLISIPLVTVFGLELSSRSPSRS